MSEGEDRVRIVANYDVCVGMGQCEFLEPEVFRLDDDGVVSILGSGSLPRANAEKVVDKCPSGALSIEGA